MHRHTWRVMKTQVKVYGTKTELYMACNCGKTKMVVRKGRWELDDFRFAEQLKEVKEKKANGR